MIERNLSTDPLDPATENIFTSWDDVAVQLGLTPGSLASILTTNGDIITRIGGVPARMTRAQLAADPAFTSQYAARYIDGEFAAIGEALRNDQAATLIVQGDSTGNETTEWVYLMTQALAAKYPSVHVKYKLWDDGSQEYGAWSVIQAGGGEKGAVFTGAGTSRSFYLNKAAVPSVTGDIDIRVRLTLADWSSSSGINQTLLARYGSVGSYCWYLQLNTAGRLQLVHSADGTTLITKTATATTGFANGATGWVRGVLDVDNGAAGNTATFYASTDGVTWTTVGTAQTAAGTTSIYDHASQGYELGGRGLTGGVINGTIYEAQIRNGIAGPIVNPQPITSWYGRLLTGGYAAGAFTPNTPTLYVVNGSHPGATTAYLSDTTRHPLMVPLSPGATEIVSCSHNDNTLSDAEFLSARDTWQGLIDARLPGGCTIHLTQNPTKSPVEQPNIDGQARRRLRLISWTARKGVGLIDTYKAFTDYPGGFASLLNSDGVHPTNTVGSNAGSQLWADTIMAAYNTAA